MIHENGCPWNIDTCALAAHHGGHLDILKYLHKNGLRITEDDCCIAAEYGHLEMGCPRQLHGNDRTCMKAIENGHLEIVEYLH